MHQWGDSPLYDGQKMAYSNHVIVVTFNYRLGSFGSFYDPQNGFQGNYGYLDQVRALEFVYDNIPYFGGDKERIVLFGESAGYEHHDDALQHNSLWMGALCIHSERCRWLLC